MAAQTLMTKYGQKQAEAAHVGKGKKCMIHTFDSHHNSKGLEIVFRHAYNRQK